jgi:hypothetical protein
MYPTYLEQTVEIGVEYVYRATLALEIWRGLGVQVEHM